MASQSAIRRRFPVTYLSAGAVIVVAAVIALGYLSRPAHVTSQTRPASEEARAYVPNLALSDVNMKATENFMKQQVVEIEGKIANHGERSVDSIDVYCIFRDVKGHEMYRQRSRILQTKGSAFKPGEARSFRLAFDELPDGWNQAMPTLVIAQIAFAR